MTDQRAGPSDQQPLIGPPRAAAPVRSLRVLGVRVDDVTLAEAAALVERWLDEPGPHPVVTPNPEIVLQARDDPEFRAVLDAAALAIPDGVGLLLAARLLGDRLREHVRGTDLVLELAARSARAGRRWFLLGAEEGVAAEAGRRLAARFPGLQIAGAAPGSPWPEDDPAVRALIGAAGPVDLVLVAYGAGRQERWLARNLGPLGIPVGLGIGGTLNYLSGRAPRAPAWLRRLELEWLHRLVTQPWRWRRQARLPLFVLLVLAEAARRRRSPA